MIIRLFLLLMAASLFPLNIVFQTKPSTYQLYPRNESNVGIIQIKGTSKDVGLDTFSVILTRNDIKMSRVVKPAVYSADSAVFDFQIPIHAELAEYGIRFYADTALALAADSIVAGDAYAINGQSNSITFIIGDIHEYIRTWSASENKWKISETGLQYGAQCDVGMWGQQLGFHINQEQGLPVFIVNGGKPSMGISYFMPTGSSGGYADVLNRATKAGLKDHIKAHFWYQGEANSSESGLVGYLSSFQQIYQAWKRDYPAMKKVYAFQLGVWYQASDVDVPWARNMREIQRRLPETFSDLSVMSTLGSPGAGGHWNTEGYRAIADKIYKCVARDFYKSGDTIGITPPNILRAYYSTAAKDHITLLFDQPTFWRDSLGHKLKDYFALDSAYQQVDSGWEDPDFNRIVLKLKTPSNATKITYLTAGFYLPGDRAGIATGTAPTYMGPFLFNARRIGALSFHEVPIEDPKTVDTTIVTSVVLSSSKASLKLFESVQLQAITDYSGGIKDTNRGISFRSLDPFIAAVSPNGLVRAYNPGTVRIRAAKGVKSDTVNISVVNSYTTISALTFTAKAKSLRTMLQGDSLPLSLAALVVENGDTLRFSMDTMAAVNVKEPELQLKANFIYGISGGENLPVYASGAGLRCTTFVNVVPSPRFIRRINFQAANSAQTSIPGWIMESGTVYSKTRGVGWVNPGTFTGYLLNAGSEPNYFRRTMLYGPKAGNSLPYRIDAPAGKYRIRIRNFNYFFCSGSSYVCQGSDTLINNKLCNYQWDFDMQVTKDIIVTGDSGLVLNIYGAINYIVLVSDDGTDFNLLAKDEMGPVYPAPITTAAEESTAVQSETVTETPVAAPNPFNPATVIRFSLPSMVGAEYGIFNVRGQSIKRFHLSAVRGMSMRMVQFGENGNVKNASGIYYGRLIRSDGKTFSHKLMLVR
ncbi:MAG: Ig-like domain-containing protein [Fibrobacteres bacterium]|nr:Ig-like domain-containing protein [Fibrobacterota bacterium]